MSFGTDDLRVNLLLNETLFVVLLEDEKNTIEYAS